MSQIALPLETSSSTKHDGYIVTAANMHVERQIRNWQEWPLGTAVLIGSKRSGKSSMATQFTSDSGGYMLDDAETAEDDTIFHLWNRAKESGSALLLTSAKPITDWGISLPDLKSRLSQSLLMEIGVPDEAMIEGLLQKYFISRGMAISEDALAYLTKRMERSYHFVQLLAEIMDKLAIERKKPVALAIAREALQACAEKWEEKDS